MLDSKSREHTVLRDSVLPELLENLSRNIHVAYPQKIFETGTIFLEGDPVSEMTSLAAVSAHPDASFTEIKSVLQSCLGTGFGMKIQTHTSVHPTFQKGRCADIMINDQSVGTIGEIASEVVRNHKIRNPVAGFEISLSETIL